MSINKEEFYRCVLFISDTEEKFIVIPKERKNPEENSRWELPNLGHYFPEFDPIDMTIWLTQTYLNLRLKESNLRLKFTAKDEAGCKVHLFENNSLTPEISELFKKGRQKNWYETMSYHQAGLANSGLDCFQKEILGRVGLIKVHSLPFKYHLQNVY